MTHLTIKNNVALPIFLISISFIAGLSLFSYRVAADPASTGNGSKYGLKFACSDNAKDYVTSVDKKNHRVTIKCKSPKASIDYYNTDQNAKNETNILTATVTCPANNSVDPEAATDAKTKAIYYVVYCDLIDHSKPTGFSHNTKATPSVSKGVTRTNPDSPKSTAAAATQSGINAATLPQVAANQDTISRILDILFGIIGGIAVLVVGVGGMRYVFANGDSNAVAQAKNTIIYALIGLVVAISGFTIVTFVIKGLS